MEYLILEDPIILLLPLLLLIIIMLHPVSLNLKYGMSIGFLPDEEEVVVVVVVDNIPLYHEMIESGGIAMVTILMEDLPFLGVVVVVEERVGMDPFTTIPMSREVVVGVVLDMHDIFILPIGQVLRRGVV